MNRKSRTATHSSIPTDDLLEKILCEGVADILTSVGEGIVILDRSGVVNYCNPAALELLDYSQEEVLGLVFHDVVHNKGGEDSAHDIADCPILSTTHRAEEYQSESEVFLAKGNNAIPVRITARAVVHGGVMVGSVISFHDISVRKEVERKLRDSEERFELAVQAANEGIWDWNIRTGKVYISPRWKMMLGFEAHELENSLETWTSRVHPEDLSQAMMDLEDYLDGKRPEYEETIRVMHHDGSYRWHRNRWIAIRDESGMAVRIVGTCSDVTEDVCLREKLEHALERAEAANLAKSEFLANMSHEIRTPLTAIIGFAESTLESGQSMEERIESIGAIIANGQHLRVLIDDILDLSKIEADRLEIEEIEINLIGQLTKFFSSIKAQVEQRNLGFGIHYVPPLPSTILTDPTRLRQILYNLCNNAMKFTEHGDLRVIISCDVPSRKLLVTVFDSGIGMTQEQVERIFEPFVQADSTVTRRFGGTGLGLNISRRLAHRLGGDIQVLSLPGTGSVFVLTIDTGHIDEDKLLYEFRDLPQEDERTGSSRRPPSVQGKILLAEDNLYNQRLISLYVRKTGAELAIAENGEQAVEMALRETFDLILMDLQMPIMGGLDATRMLRQTLYPGPIVALTAHSMIGDRSNALEAGCTDFLSKPVDWPALYEVIGKYLPEDDGNPSFALPGSLPDMGDTEFTELVEKFITELPGNIEQLIAHSGKGEWDEVRALAHQLKGVAGGFGFPGITQLAGDIEFQTTRQSTQEAVYLIQNLQELVMDLINKHLHNRENDES
ncbi:PAS domain-containing sensor histidine kinase [endosymbiont of Riftia pachyptila]|uniref:histidine kinase n=1 Tax=endosymbiont of Riftia pachyptila (vent Ph05) TaxID=1048808 RepID=G2DC69_9GAMM|nr:PAS domain-containing hybrid sensor histidine kinase/response regulator [endosymbiont of Riftia pachyptila]EGV51794.1 multi-sensor hybrid histidine kinase [endosymbiont of Riftia pachyptila (vent Ph05)]